MEIRPATEADVPAITAIYRPAVETGFATFELTPPGEAEMRRRMLAITEGGYPYLVAVVDGAVAGYAYVSAYRTRPAYRFTVENSIYIKQSMQGRRVGTALMGRLISDCTERGFRLMVAVIGDSANFGSITLHRRCGFHFCGTIHSVGYKLGRWLDSVVMELPLGQGENTPPEDGQLPLPLRNGA
ncbi:MAG: GNAT family N-acetyltransferase [Hyphomicrobiaceae bacterium]|nr:GNAT family N-acetyltransferase [Hyphomicrobiaceae bacterium]